jgi:hypothetical protein
LLAVVLVFLVSLLPLAACVGGAPSVALLADSAYSDIDDYIIQKMAEENVPGLAWRWSMGGQITTSRVTPPSAWPNPRR